MKKNSYFIFLLLAAFLIRLIFILGGHYISPDGTHYASLGYHLFHDLRYVSDGAQFPDIIQPPLYPVLLGLLSLLLNPEYAGKFTSLLFGLALIAVLYRFTKRLTGNEKLAFAAALFVALDPAMVAVSSQVASEALYLFLLFALYATVLFYLRENRRSQIVAAALLNGLLYLTRPEGILYFVLLLLVFLVWRKPWRHVVMYFGLVMSFMVLYSWATHKELGYWTFSPKLNFVRAQGKVSRYFLQRDRQLNRTVEKKVRVQRTQYALSPHLKELAANEIFKKNKSALRYFKISPRTSKEKSRLLKQAARHLYSNVILAAKKFLNGLAFPLGFWIFLLFGLWRFPLKKWKSAAGFSALFLTPVLLVLFVNVEQRFLFMVPILLAPLLGRGWLRIEHFLQERLWPQKRSALSWIILYLFVFLSVYPGYAELWRKTRSKNYYYQVGRWLQKEIPDKKVVAAVRPQAVFFAGKRYCPLPFAPLDSLELYLRAKQAAFILLEEGDQKLRPGLLTLKRLPPFLRRDTTVQIQNKNFWLLRVTKEKTHERTNAIH